MVMRRFVGLAAAILVAAGLVFPASAIERVIDFHSAIEVHPDSTMTVTETIRVNAEGQQIRRGIFREFPTTYKTRAGRKMTVGFAIEEVLRDGAREPYRIEDRDNGKAVYIGRAEVFLKPGQYTYTIRYRTDRQLGYFPDYDELYWNVTGNGWRLPIERVRAEVTLPAGARILQHAAYTGPQGATGQDFTARSAGAGIAFQTTRALPPGAGLTIALAWPKGVVSPPSAEQRFRYFLRDWGLDVAAGGGVLVVLAYFLVVWLGVGRDPAKGRIIPLFAPPAGFFPAAVRYVDNMGYDGRAFAATVVNLAVHRLLTIEQASGAYRLRRRAGGNAQGLNAGETAVYSRLLGGTDTVELIQSNHVRVGGANDALRESLAGQFMPRYFITNLPYFFIGLAISVLAGIAIIVMQPSVVAIVGGLAALVGVNLLFLWLLRAPTLAGRQVMDQLEGFRMYMMAAEKDRLNVLNPPNKTPELFEKFLPYALALGVEQQWAEQFAGVLGAAGMQPDWYSSDSGDSFSGSRLASDLGSGLSGAISSASTAPGDSSSGGGSSGGGSSGGGGGGGGGGGW